MINSSLTNRPGVTVAWRVSPTMTIKGVEHSANALLAADLHERFQAKPSPDIEAWSSLPDVFYWWNQNDRGWQYFKHVLDSRSRYPEVSFAVVSHIATRIMDIEPDAPRRAVITLGRLPSEVAQAELDHVPALIFKHPQIQLEPVAFFKMPLRIERPSAASVRDIA